MEHWLAEMIRSLPAGLKNEVEGYLDEGTFISFAGLGTGGEASAGENGIGQKGRDVKTPIEDLLKEQAWKETERRIYENGNYVSFVLPSGLHSESLLKAALLKGAAFWPGSVLEKVEDNNGYAIELVRDPEVFTVDLRGHDETAIRTGMGRIAESLSEFTARFEC